MVRIIVCAMCRIIAILLAFTLLLRGEDVLSPVGKTIERCRGELKSEAVGVRVSAVMVLGKYDLPEVGELLGEALGDPSEEVRLCALVALVEKPNLLRGQGARVMRLLRDGDVHVRRLASSHIPECMGIFVSGRIQYSGGVRITTGDSSRPEFGDFIVSGLMDEDAEVRRNVLEGAQFYGLSLPFASVKGFLSDDNPQTVILATTLAVRSDGNAAEILDALSPLVRHPSAGVRITLANSLGSLPGSLPLFRELSKDPSTSVASSALVARGRARFPEDLTLATEIRDFVRSEKPAAAEKERLLAILVEDADDATWEFLREILFGDSSSPLQGEAWIRVLRRDKLRDRLTVHELAEAMAKHASAVNNSLRAMLVSNIRRRASELTKEDILVMQASPLAPSRKAVLDIIRVIPEPLRADALLEALLDEDTGIRTQAVGLLPTLRPEGWETLLIDTLSDTNPLLQQEAARGLLRSTSRAPEIQDALRNWLPKCPDSQLRERIERKLR